MDAARYAVVTGGSRGIGATVAKRLAEAGYHVVLTYRSDSARAQAVCDEIRDSGGTASCDQVDLTSIGDVLAFCARLQQLPGIDAIINIAVAPASVTPISELSLDEWNAQLMASATAPFLILHHLDARLRPGAAIVNISTINAGDHPGTGLAAYAAGKGALEQLTAIAAQALGSRDITVNTVRPGVTATRDRGADVLEQVREMTPLRRIGTTDDIADVIEFLVSAQGRWLTGQTLTASGGM